MPINHIPYRGGGLALNDVIAGQVKFFFSNGSSSVGLVQGGKVRAIAHTGKGRLGTLPDLPSVDETLPGFVAYEWNGVFVPTGTPPDIVKKLNAGLNEVLRQPDVIAHLKQLNVDFKPNTPDEFRAFVADETAKWGKVVREAGIKIGGWRRPVLDNKKPRGRSRGFSIDRCDGSGPCSHPDHEVVESHLGDLVQRYESSLYGTRLSYIFLEHLVGLRSSA